MHNDSIELRTLKENAAAQPPLPTGVPSMTDDLGGGSPSGELIAATRVNRKAGSVSDSLKAAESETCGATYRNRIRGGGVGGERACNREASAIKRRFRISGARAGTAIASYLGRSRLMPERVPPRAGGDGGARSQQRPQ